VRPIRLMRLGMLLARLSRPPTAGADDPEPIEEQERTSAAGAGYTLYLPKQHQAMAQVIAVHGMTVNDRHDHRLVHFARTLARSGLACATPTLSGLRDGRFDPHDPEALASVALELSRESARRVGLVGFSFGGSQALLAATRPELAEAVRFVVAFGAYHSLADLFEHFRALELQEPRQPAEIENTIYLILMLAHTLPEKLPWSAALREEAEQLLRTYCQAPALPRKRDFYDRHLRGLHLVEQALLEVPRASVTALSPAGQLAGLRCPVSLIHDEHDTLVPAQHSRRLHAELRGLGKTSTLLVTPLLSHVALSEVRHLPDVWKLCAALEPLAAAFEG
jgi:pimeloyl-ACP methyl ester carboxylesterase